jgi:hypothetical protein
MRKKFKVTRTLRKKINELANQVGCPLNWRRSCGIQWNGEDVACKGEDASNIIHDIAHYVLATKKERSYNDFGLGPSPSTKVPWNQWDQLYERVSIGKANKIEEKASALGIYWEKQMGLPWEDTADYHFWHDEDKLKKFWKKLKHHTRKYKLGETNVTTRKSKKGRSKSRR